VLERFPIAKSNPNGVVYRRTVCKPCYSLTSRRNRTTEVGRAKYNKAMRVINMRRRAIKLSLPHVAYDAQEIYTRDDGVCVLCGHQVDPENYEVEHIVPLQVDAQLLLSYDVGNHPGDVPWNVSIAHPSCNSSKGNRMTQEDRARYLLWRYMYKEQHDTPQGV